MDKQLNFLYDHNTDVLYISSGHPIHTDSVALDENVILHLEPATEKIVGFSIVDFIKRFANTEMPASIPIGARFERVGKKPSPDKSRRARRHSR